MSVFKLFHAIGKLHSRDFRPQAPSVHQHQARSRYICVRPNPSQHHAQISFRAVTGRDLNHFEGKLNCEGKLYGRQRGSINLKPFFPWSETKLGHSWNGSLHVSLSETLNYAHQYLCFSICNIHENQISKITSTVFATIPNRNMALLKYTPWAWQQKQTGGMHFQKKIKKKWRNCSVGPIWSPQIRLPCLSLVEHGCRKPIQSSRF